MIPVTLSVIGLVLLLALVVAVAWAARVIPRSFEAREPSESPQPYDDANVWGAVHDLGALIKEARERTDGIVLAVAEGIERVERSERRVRQTVASAKRRFEAEGYVDPGLEAEAAALPDDDAPSRPAEPVPAVPEGVESEDPYAGVPGLMTFDE